MKLIRKNITFPIYWLITLLITLLYACQNTTPTQQNETLVSNTPTLPLKIGDKAPEISLQNTQGETQNLSQIIPNHKLLLIDFWASWCSPCRAENPNLVKIYEKYKKQGFTIYSVSLDTDKEKWLQAIKKDGLTWQYQVSDLMGWDSEAGIIYGIEGIPMNFLVDEKGVIQAQNLRGEALEKTIEGILNR